MRLLDLFCGAGGAAMGYHQAGFDEIVGVDIVPQPNYPFTFIQADALAFMDAMMSGTEDIGYGLVHASPPCQRWSMGRHSDNHPDLVEQTQEYLEIIGRPYVIENVPQAPLRRDVVLCGTQFGLDIKRHRVFETSFGPLLVPPCNHRWADPDAPYLVAGHGGGWNLSHRNFRTLAHAKALMGMDWITHRREVTEAIPPAYTKFIGEQFLAQ